jgi:hypothetical protein
MRRSCLALLLVVSACSGSSSTPVPTSAPTGFTLPGPWTLQTVASNSCSGLSADVRSRTYKVSVYQTGYDTISMDVAVNGVLAPLMNPSYSGLKIQDHLRLVDNSIVGGLVIDGTFTGTVSSSRIAGTLNGNFTTATADCVAADHALTFTRG